MRRLTPLVLLFEIEMLRYELIVNNKSLKYDLAMGFVIFALVFGVPVVDGIMFLIEG